MKNLVLFILLVSGLTYCLCAPAKDVWKQLSPPKNGGAPVYIQANSFKNNIAEYSQKTVLPPAHAKLFSKKYPSSTYIIYIKELNCKTHVTKNIKSSIYDKNGKVVGVQQPKKDASYTIDLKNAWDSETYSFVCLHKNG